jgi:hypothetical protein
MFDRKLFMDLLGGTRKNVELSETRVLKSVPELLPIRVDRQIRKKRIEDSCHRRHAPS